MLLPTRPLDHLSVAELTRLCAKETRNFLLHLPFDDQYGFELFRRAIARRDDAAWASIVAQYSPLVLTWIMQHQEAISIVAREGSSDPLLNAVFAKFALALTPAKMDHFGALAPLLQYLKLCVRSVVADELRTYRCGQAHESENLEELEEIEVDARLVNPRDPIEEMLSRLEGQEIWLAVLGSLHDGTERELLYLTYVDGLKPAEITNMYRHLFPTVDGVYRLKRNMIARLRRNRELMRWLQQRGYYHPEDEGGSLIG